MRELPADPYSRHRPSRQLLDRLGDRWTVLVVEALAHKPLRFSQLAARTGVSQKMLTQTLRALERDGLVTRTVYPQIPPQVEYELTEAGHTLREPVKALEDWATTHMPAILAAREHYDTTQIPARASE